MKCLPAPPAPAVWFGTPEMGLDDTRLSESQSAEVQGPNCSGGILCCQGPCEICTSQDLDRVPGCSTLGHTNGLQIHVRAAGCQVRKLARGTEPTREICVQADQVANRMQLTFRRELLPRKSSLPWDVVCRLRRRHF